MHFAIVCLDKPQSADLRARNRPAHLEHLESRRAQILAAGPLLSDDGQTPVGSLLVMEFADLEAARAFAAEDPYNQAGLFRSVTICPWRKVLP